jgi:hypothetical protein
MLLRNIALNVETMVFKEPAQGRGDRRGGVHRLPGQDPLIPGESTTMTWRHRV